MHLRFDKYEELYRPTPTCFKKDDEYRADLPMMVCNKLYVFDNEQVSWYHLSLECSLHNGGHAILRHFKAVTSSSIYEAAPHPYFQGDVMQY